MVRRLIMSKQLRLTKSGAIAQLNILLDSMSNKYSIPFVLDYKRSFLSASTVNNTSGHAVSVMIGINDLQKSQNGIINFLVPNENFVNVIINTYHEAMHVCQKNILFQDENAESNIKRQAITAIARYGNNNYYKCNGNYDKNPNKIQAEWYGVKSAYDYLCDVYSNIDREHHEKLILNAINEKVRHTYCIHPKDGMTFHSFDELMSAYEDAYSQSFTRRRDYRVTDSENKDVAKLYMDEHVEARKVYLQQKDGIKQDECVAAINCKIHSEYTSIFSCLNDNDLSYERIIEEPYKKMQESRENALNKLVRRIDDCKLQLDNQYEID